MSTDQESQQIPQGVAIIGMACRFPGSATPEKFWQNLREGVDLVRTLSDEELDKAAIDPDELADPRYVRARAVLEGIDQFDARFFEFSPREAELTDPQQRLFLECVWESLERAGYDPGRSPGPIGLYAGAGANGYLLHNLSRAGFLMGTVNAFQASIQNKNDHLSTRTAYKLNLKGPAVTVQTACSTSLVAVVHACQALLNFQCDMALAGGSTVTVPQNVGYLYAERGIGSPDGRCRAFDSRAQGTVGGSGVGVVLLKRLEDAVADGDLIHAVIRAGALNNDGSNKVGYTAPSVDGQAEVIALAHALADVDPETITYVEAHGTGTPLGDPIEISALTRAFRRRTQKRSFCAVGSLKTNMGHMDTAAGVAGLMKTALALQHRELPPSLHFEKPNPEIDFGSSPFYVNSRLTEWKSEGPRRAGVSSFGLGGTNAHAILEEAPPRRASGPSRPVQVLQLSARTGPALEEMTTRLARHLQENPGLSLADVAYTLHVGRRAFNHRRFVVCRGVEEAAQVLSTLAPDRLFSRVQEPVRRPLYFMFPGQGSQQPGMAAGLYAEEPVFREELERCLEVLRRREDLDLHSLLVKDSPEDAEAARRLEQTALTQPALFAVEYALARLLMSWGLRPSAMIGHSVGELVAACLAGVFSLEDALSLVALRGRLMQSMPPGAMLSVQLPEREVQALLEGGLELAAVNGPATCVVAGPAAAVAALEQKLAAREVVCRRLRTSHAFHTSVMEPMLGAFREAVARVPRQAPEMRFLSNVTGTWATEQQAQDPDYWAQHLRQPVRFAAGLQVLLQESEAALLEVGPGKALQTLARWHPRKQPGQYMFTTLPPAGERTPALEYLLKTVGNLWLIGVETPELYAGQQRRRELLPTYPFERQRYWVDLQPQEHTARSGTLEKEADVSRWFYLPVWRESPPLPQGAPKASGPWLVLLDRAGLGARVAERLQHQGQELVQVSLGRAFKRTGADRYELDPTRPEDWAALFSELHTDRRLPRRIVHLFGLTPELPGTAGAPSADVVLERSFHSLLFLAQALGAHAQTQHVSLLVVSNNMQEVVGGELLWPEQATVLGPCQVIPREYPNVSCRSVDVVLPPAGPHQERLVELLAQELSSEVSEVAVAWRGGRRWVRDFEHTRLEPGVAPLLREAGVYLITGGLGGMGLSFASYLAGKVRARLVLVGRSELPPRSEWATWLAEHGPEDRTRQRLEAVQRLEAQGAEVLLVQADVANAAQVQAAVEQARARFGAVHGVIHAAGVAGGGFIAMRTKEAASAVLAPKVSGTRALAQALEGTPLDFFVACSSLSSVVGRLGQVDYTAANTYLDAYMRAWHWRTGTFAVSANWGAWSEVGMAARPEADKGRTLDHPFLQRCLQDTPKRMVFACNFGDARSLWVVDEHRILGNPTVPGVTYFEMVRAALAPRAEGRAIEILDGFFLAPLRVPEGETREVRLILEEDGDGYRWVVRSLGQGGGKGTDHAAGRARVGGPRPVKTLDLGELRRRCNRPPPESLDAEYEQELGPRWKSVQRIYPGQGELLMVLEMMPEFHGDFAQMKMHPSLIDRTSGMAKSFLAEHGYYLPLGYRVLRLHGDFPPRIYSYARFRAQELTDGETLAFDVTIMDEHGRVLAEVERLTQKRVNDPGTELRALAQATSAASPVMLQTSEEISPPEGVEALERLLSGRVMPQVVVSVRDLHASIARTDEVVRERVLAAAAQGGSRAPGESKPRPDLKSPYVAPRNEIERRIAQAWQQVLGLEQVGVHDDFFELGGDSVQAIQIIAKGSQSGLNLSPQQFFQHSTIADLARMLEGLLSKQAEQGPVMGPVPLTPEQRRLVEQESAHAARTLLLESSEPLEASALAQALGELVAHHDVLRHTFTRGAEGWQQVGVAPGEAPEVLQVDVAGKAQPEQAVHEVAQSLRGRLDPSTGRLLASALLSRGAGQHAWLLLVGHELVVDSASWRILVEDLAAALRKQRGGEGLRLKTASFKRWVERLREEGSSEAVRGEAAVWLAEPWESAARLPEERGSTAAGPVLTQVVVLGAEETRQLLERASTSHRAELRELVLTALAQALAGWTGGRTLRLDLTAEGREVLEGLDTARTVGCFEATFPALLETPGGATPVALLKSVKERLRRVPRRGLGFGLLRELPGEEFERLRRLPPAEVRLRHMETDLPPQVASLSVVGGLGPVEGRPLLAGYRLEVESALAGGQLHLRCTADASACQPATLERLLGEALGALRALGSEQQQGDSSLTTADFPLAGLDESQLGMLAALIDEADS